MTAEQIKAVAARAAADANPELDEIVTRAIEKYGLKSIRQADAVKVGLAIADIQRQSYVCGAMTIINTAKRLAEEEGNA